MKRLYGGVRLLDGIGPSPRNVEKIDMGAMPLIYKMSQLGLEVDLDHFARMDSELTRDMDKYVEDIHTITGHYINPGSGDQVAELLFKKLKLKQARAKMTPSGDRESVEDAVLTAIQHQHAVVPIIQNYKEVEKLRGTYVRPMPKLARRVGFGVWRMFPNFRTTRVPSGRLACSDPNLLAMPTRTDRGREVRKGFKARAGWVICSVDESQIEVRMAAHRSKDPNLIKVYQNEEDIYSDFAISANRLADTRYRDASGWHYPSVDKMKHRRPCKICVLAAIYDVTAMGLQAQMPVVCANCDKEATEHNCGRFRPMWTEEACQGILNAFYTRYPGLMVMRKRDHAYMRRNAYMVDMWGRILHCQAVRSVLDWVVSACLREGSNFPMQAGAQGTIKLAMAAVNDDLEANGGTMLEVVQPLLQVHDELVFEVREDVAEEWNDQVAWRFESLFHGVFETMIKASQAMAMTWGDLPK